MRALQPGPVDLDLGVVGPCPPGSTDAFEVRAFFPEDGATVEDPVTGNLNAALAQWLLSTGRVTAPYSALAPTLAAQLLSVSPSAAMLASAAVAAAAGVAALALEREIPVAIRLTPNPKRVQAAGALSAAETPPTPATGVR